MAIARKRPQPFPDNPLGGGPTRAGRYGEAFTQPLSYTGSKHSHADEGGYFVATNPTPGSAITFAVNASSDFTKSLFIFKNTASTDGNGPRMYLDYIKVIPAQAPASATSMHFAIQIDDINRYTSGGTLVSGVNVNKDSDIAAVGAVYYATSAVITTATAGANVRLVSRGIARSVIPAVLDEIVIQFGSWGDAGSSSGTTAGRTSTNAAPVILGPGHQAVVNVWFPSNSITALTYEFECGWFER